VIDPDPQQLDEPVSALRAAGFYADAGRAKDALHRRRQFNAVDMSTAFRVDLVSARTERLAARSFSAASGSIWPVNA
jgi:hypothetical protein